MQSIGFLKLITKEFTYGIIIVLVKHFARSISLETNKIFSNWKYVSYRHTAVVSRLSGIHIQREGEKEMNVTDDTLYMLCMRERECDSSCQPYIQTHRTQRAFIELMLFYC